MELGSSAGLEATLDATWDAAASTPATDALLCVEPGTAIGRYVVSERIGTGSMGVVYAARDPQLGREIALKLVIPGSRSRAPAATANLLREAQAIARLNHPNVIPVHDAGLHEGHMFIAMELVTGTTLTRWLSSELRSWRDVLRTMVQAGDGLAAAHDTGLIHRDFKPDNVLVGDDGRVRVLDFGLARITDRTSDDDGLLDRARTTRDGGASAASASAGTGIAGTPAYMAPEQFKGEAPGPAADQFSFCVALWEGLFGARPFEGDSYMSLGAAVTLGRRNAPPVGANVPRWLVRVLDRGLALEANRRWPSMQALLDRLRRGLRRTQVHAVWMTGGALLAAGAVFAGQDDDPTCSGAQRQLAGVWDDEVRAAARDGFESSNLAFAPDVWHRIEPELDDYARQWVEAHDDACAATHIRHEQSASVMTARMSCLAQRRRTLRSFAHAFRAPTPEAIEGALQAVKRLPPISSCADLEYISAAEPPPDDPEVAQRVDELRTRIARADAIAAVGDITNALEGMRTAAAEAQLVDYPPLHTEASLALGRLEDIAGNYEEAESQLRRAFFGASRTGSSHSLAEAATALVSVVGDRRGRLDEAMQWSRHAEAALDATGGDRVALWNAVGSVHHRSGELEVALSCYDKALRGAETSGDPLTVAVTVDNIGAAYQELGDFAKARSLHERSLAIRKEVLGPQHPSIADSVVYLANVDQEAGRLEQSVAGYRQAMEALSAAYGPRSARLAGLHNNVGRIEFMRGNLETALGHFEESVELFETHRGPDHPMVATALNAQGATLRRLDRVDEALSVVRRAVEIQERALGADHANRGITLTSLANIYDARGNSQEALSAHEEAERIWRASLGSEHHLVATAIGNQALSHVKLGNPGRAVSLLGEALEIQEAALGLDHPDVALTLRSLGHALNADERPREAVPSLRRALEIQEVHGIDGQARGEVEMTLARALWAAGDRREASAHAESARETFLEHDAAQHRANADEWIRRHPPPPR